MSRLRNFSHKHPYLVVGIGILGLTFMFLGLYFRSHLYKHQVQFLLLVGIVLFLWGSIFLVIMPDKTDYADDQEKKFWQKALFFTKGFWIFMSLIYVAYTIYLGWIFPY